MHTVPLTVRNANADGRVIAVGASTGGTEALKALLVPLPATLPPIVIVQHMPAMFTGSFARRLDGLCALTVREAEHGDVLLPGHAYLAPGHSHLLLARLGGRLCCALSQADAVNRHRPSVEVLFQSVAELVGARALGVMLTGMGKDGATGMRAMRDAGAYNFAQDEASATVFGMPKEAIALGGVDEILPLARIPERLQARLALPR
ncbi:chemotaxis protein CheB [Jeongeupia sp. USM3]|uniref:chemotaxis protein CheB n=1 Tax=Jeongeupia sp. USM3 TaxID=1906741 RepID=UPI00089DF3E3|nr:chemotaxis protein CheB [Jeongeupia sp. USM3]AOX99951.1 chemotaxis protein CheB [Jeongeupia sp. USM3]